MVFNKSWTFLKSLEDEQAIKETKEYMDMMEQARNALLFPNHPQYTIENNYQTKLPMHDPRLDYTTGWEGWDPVRAVRVQGTHRPAGQPVPQDGSNIYYEEGDPRLPPLVPKIPDDNDPVWNDPNSRWNKDPISNVPYYMAGGHRDGKYHPRARKVFAGLKNAKAGTWVSNNTMGDINNLYTHNAPGKLVYIRGNLDKYGKVHRRDSDEAREDLAEAFIEHDENIPRESLVEVPLRQHYRDQTLQMGTPNLGRNISNTDRRPSGRISRWSDKPLPWGKPMKRKQIEDMDEDELHNLFYGKTKDEIYELTKGSPMEIAFQLLKDYPVDDSGDYPYIPKWAVPKYEMYGKNWIALNAADGLVQIKRSPIFRERRRHIQQALEDAYNFQPEFVGSIPKNQATLSARDKRRRMFVGATGREYETREHRAAVEPSTETHEVTYYDWGYTNPRTKNEWAPPKPPVNPNVDEPYDEMYNQYYNVSTGEPMNIAFQLLKERKSPAAFAHKLEYDKQYQKTPKRVKYREQLNAERRKRGIYGKGGKDVSHTQGGKLTLESAHANRARHFKNKGTLRRVKVKK